jgi:uncharacterized membrane protein
MLFSAILLGVVPFFTGLGVDVSGQEWNLELQWVSGMPYILIPVSFFLLSVFVLINIFNYNNRKLQIRWNSIVILSALALSGYIAYLLFVSGEKEFSKKGIEGIFPLIVVILLWLANRAIGKDEALVKSMDRIR